MTALRYDFASDNAAGAAPEAMQALIEANDGPAPGYGADQTTRAAADAVRAFLDSDAQVRFLASGTAANALALSMLARPFEAVLCHADAHVLADEAGAPQGFGGGLRLVPLSGASARIDPSALRAALSAPEDARFQPPAALALTQATEYGAVYSEAALQALVQDAKARGLGVFLDGARLANAVAAGFDPKLLARIGVDVVVLGGAKAGMPPTEALAVLNPALKARLDVRLKHLGQLVSKGRFLAAPWFGMLREGAFVGRAAHANAMARRLAERSAFPLAHPPEANLVFVRMDEAALARLRAAGWAAHRAADGSVRFVCSWATTPGAVDALGEALAASA